MFDDFDSWDGLSGLGALVAIGGWGVVAYLAYAFGFQSGLDASSQCVAKAPSCIVEIRRGWFGIEYKAVKILPVKQP
ncbi:hypothetical protein [Burkholderia vietnamiensis]|uniref:hypothetical protein n=1 Tax=Burkholderia vietnamiensis TaxID=60552 RepID=UPI000B2F695E|nr:hypothetical protein [Burkholderia vietnamiensis]